MVPRDLVRLHDLLRNHFRHDAEVEVVVEQRGRDRRVSADRRTEARGASPDRRRIRNAGGRRVGDRRAVAAPVESPPLPRRARRYAERLVFVERMELSEVALEDVDTARLVTRYQAGDAEAFTVIYMRYFDRLYNYMRLLMRDSGDAEDATQQVFMKVFEALPRYERRGGPFRAWLFTIARNQAASLLRRRYELPLEPEELSRHTDRGAASEPVLNPLDWISDPELLLFIERLPLLQRQVLVLHYMLDLSHSETAAALGRTPEAVRALQHRAVRMLEQRLTALGRAPRVSDKARMRRWPRRAPVLRARRWALTS